MSILAPESFISFDTSTPEPNRYILVTNNLMSKNAHGEMSHLWLTTNTFKSSGSSAGIICYLFNNIRVENLTHWKYA